MQLPLTIVAGLCLLIMSVAMFRYAPLWAWFPTCLIWLIVVAKARGIVEADMFFGYGSDEESD